MHLLVRERHPFSALVGGRRARAALAGRPFTELVALIRRPPRWSISGFPVVDRALNTVEFFVHHEDVRRARPDWRPRGLPRRREAELWRRLGPVAKLNLRRFPAAVLVEAPGYGRLRAGRGGPSVRIVGAPGEIALFVYGRQPVARGLAVIGPDAVVERISTAALGW